MADTWASRMQLLWISWVMLAPFLWFTMFARRTFRFTGSGGPGVMLAALSMMSGFWLAVWAGRHGAYDSMRWTAGVVVAICSIGLYESARHVVTGRGFCAALSGEVPPAICTEGPYHYIRHPVYTSYLLAFLALLIAFPGSETGFVFLANLAFFVYVATDEEGTIAHSQIAEAYASYRRGTGMFFPRVGRPPERNAP